MKKLRIVLGLVLLLSIVLSPTKFVSAAVMSENDSTITVREITEAEFEQYDLSDWICTEYAPEISGPKINTRASYDIVNRTITHNIYADPADEVPAAILKCTYTIYYYTDNKVHLYTKSITTYTPPTYANSYFRYGDIYNTDGSISSTVDKFVLYKDSTPIAFMNVHFGVTPTYYRGWIDEI